MFITKFICIYLNALWALWNWKKVFYFYFFVFLFFCALLH